MATLAPNLVERLNENFNLTVAVMAGWPPKGEFPTIRPEYNASQNLQMVPYSTRPEYRLTKLTKVPNSIIIIGYRLPLYMRDSLFDNKEGGIEVGAKVVEYKLPVEPSLRDMTSEFLENGHSVIIVYPIPAVGWNVPRKLMAKKPSNIRNLKDYLLNNPITTSYEVYLERTKSSFELLDRIQHENLHRVYPHKLFCDNQIKGRCVTHDTEHLFYADDDHPSYRGAKLINDLIIEKVKSIEAKPAN